MKTMQKFKLGEPIPDDAVLIKDEIIQEPLSTAELYEMEWPGLGPWPTRSVRYFWYEVPVIELNKDKT